MGKHIADQQRDRAEGTRTREFTRIEREQRTGGPHAAIATLRRRPSGTTTAGSRRTSEFLSRERGRHD